MNEAAQHRLQAICTDWVPNAVMAFLGGSAGRQTDMVTNSDYDIVVLAPAIDHPVSYNNIPDGTGRKVDLIVRDPGTLAFEAEACRRDGKVTVFRILQEGALIFGDQRQAEPVRAEAAKICQTGPVALCWDDYLEQLKAINNRVDAADHEDAAVKKLGLIEVTHQAADLYLRAQRQWTASGKMLGRYLLPFGKFKTRLEALYQKQNGHAISELLFDETYMLAFADQKDNLLAEKLAQETDCKLHDGFKIRNSDRYLKQIITSGDAAQKALAHEFMANKLEAVADAVNPERLGRPSNEYFYALARAVITFAKLEQYKAGKKDDVRYHHLLQQYPYIHNMVAAAETGEPEAFRQLLKTTARDLAGQRDEVFVRRSPCTFRCEPEVMF